MERAWASLDDAELERLVWVLRRAAPSSPRPVPQPSAAGPTAPPEPPRRGAAGRRVPV